MFALDHVELDRLARIHRTGEIARLARSALEAIHAPFKAARSKRRRPAAHWSSRACA
jgi:hypothetical protein